MDEQDMILLREIAAQGKRYTVGNVLATLSTPGRGRIPDAAHGQHFRCAVRTDGKPAGRLRLFARTRKGFLLRERGSIFLLGRAAGRTPALASSITNWPQLSPFGLGPSFLQQFQSTSRARWTIRR